MTDYLLKARQLLTMLEQPDGAGDADDRLVGLIENAAVWAEAGTVRWVGPFDQRPAETRVLQAVDVDVALPALVECHTHSLFAGSRHDEFAVRNRGGSYAEILEAGGGILSTVAATRAASDESLVTSLIRRLQRFEDIGCALVEVKTGYGLSHDEELRHLKLIRQAAAAVAVEVVPTYLGAHAVPLERRSDRDGYIDEICERTLPAVAADGLAEAADVFCDRGAFTAAEARRILGRAREVGLAARIHTDELSASGGCAVAAEIGATSADHLEHAGEADMAALAKADVAAVLLPGVTVFLDMPERPPARAMIDAGVRVALSTDYNPGSAHTQQLWLMATLGCTLLKLTPGEALRALTRVPAEVLGRAQRFGHVAPGSDARLITACLPSWRALPYHMAPLTRTQRVGF